MRNLASASMLAALILACCQKSPPITAAVAAPAPAAKPAQPEYHPSMSDLMNIGIQPRHIKLALAGKARNWTYAAYEADELKNAFDRIARTIPDYRGNDPGKMFDANIKPAIAGLKAAAAASDAKAFDAAYEKVTSQCNACHETLDHPMVRIRAPDDAGLFPDQDFSTPK